MKSERIDLVAPAWLKKAAQDLAASKGIKLSELIKDLLKEAIKINNDKNSNNY